MLSLSTNMAAADERNFRSSYYEKVGFRNVEEKKSLEILLKDKPLDRQKLKQFCLRFAVPTSYRSILWKAMLEITSRFPNNADFVWKQRTEQYEELLRALTVMQLVKSNTSKPVMFVLLWLLETGEIKFDLETQLDDPLFRGLITMSESVVEMVDGDVDRYWVARGLYQIIVAFQDSLPKLADATRSILEKEDPELSAHVDQLAAFDVIRVDRWFFCLFAGVLHKSALAKIWDKLIGGSLKILSFVAVTLFLCLRRQILVASTGEAVLNELSGVSDEMSDVISNKAIDLWQKYGSPLLIFDARKDDVR